VLPSGTRRSLAMCRTYCRAVIRSSAGSRSGTYPTGPGGRTTRPAVGVEAPATARISVDLPEPFPPTTSVTAPPASVASMPSSTHRPDRA
jgi:hypothetical protein